uniref:Putative ovule protein n=1 Tax=Solanum chacoense TaxID=4108 RepID=A0A0V0I5G0_SOLCH
MLFACHSAVTLSMLFHNCINHVQGELGASSSVRSLILAAGILVKLLPQRFNSTKDDKYPRLHRVPPASVDIAATSIKHCQ